MNILLCLSFSIQATLQIIKPKKIDQVNLYREGKLTDSYKFEIVDEIELHFCINPLAVISKTSDGLEDSILITNLDGQCKMLVNKEKADSILAEINFSDEIAIHYIPNDNNIVRFKGNPTDSFVCIEEKDNIKSIGLVSDELKTNTVRLSDSKTWDIYYNPDLTTLFCFKHDMGNRMFTYNYLKFYRNK